MGGNELEGRKSVALDLGVTDQHLRATANCDKKLHDMTERVALRQGLVWALWLDGLSQFWDVATHGN